MNFTQLMRSLTIRVNNCVGVFNCFPFNTARSPSPLPPSLLTCQPPVPGVFPNSIQGSGRGVSDMVTKGPPERGPQGPRRHVGLRVPHLCTGIQRSPGAATIPLRCCRCPCRLRAGAVSGGQAACAPGPGTSRQRALRPQEPGIAARAAAGSAPTAGGLLDGCQARARATSGKAYK